MRDREQTILILYSWWGQKTTVGEMRIDFEREEGRFGREGRQKPAGADLRQVLVHWGSEGDSGYITPTCQILRVEDV